MIVTLSLLPQPIHIQITLDLIRKAMDRSDGYRYLIDGFPRNEDNLLGWRSEMPNIAVDSVIFLDCQEEELMSRMHIRAAQYGRSDDNVETLNKRIGTFKDSTIPVIDTFRQMGKLRTVKAGGRSIEEVYQVLTCRLPLTLPSPGAHHVSFHLIHK